jgi:hypothetical protein
MNPAAHAPVAVLAERLGALEERQERHEEESRHRYEAHAADEAESRRAVAAALQAIQGSMHATQLDVHAIRTGKKLIVGLVVFFGAAMVGVTAWTVEHAFQDFLIKSGVVEMKRIP